MDELNLWGMEITIETQLNMVVIRGGGVSQSNHRRDGISPWFIPNTSPMNYGRKRCAMWCTYANNIQLRSSKERRLRKCGVEKCHTSPTCECSVVWLMRRCRIIGERSWMQRVLNVCFSDILKVPRCIGSFVWRWKKLSRIQSWCFSKSKYIWRIVQMGELRKHSWLRWTYPLNHRRKNWRQMTTLQNLTKNSTLRDKAEANISTTKSTYNREASEHDVDKKTATRPLQHRNMTMKRWAILGIRIGHANCLENSGRTTFHHSKTARLWNASVVCTKKDAKVW